MDIQEQIRIIAKGAMEIISREDLEAKLLRSQREGVPLTVKLGMDPTAPDLHLGHTVVLRKVRQLQDLGHRAVIIIGDFTGMIGDPTGRSRTRKQLSKEEVEANARTYEQQIIKVLDMEKTELRFNSEWLSSLNFMEVIELSSKYTVARMLEREDFKNRFRAYESIGIHEFFYPLMQAYDSIAIKADIELGGTDQRFNILMGRILQKDYGQESQVALFMPLLEGIDGKEKMSKSLGNYIGIDEAPKVMYEKVMSIPDTLIVKYWELVTDIHPDALDKIRQELEQGEAHPRDRKMALAKEVVRIYHGEEAAETAEKSFMSVFQRGELPDELQTLTVTQEDLVDGRFMLPRLMVRAGLTSSTSEARRLIEQGAVKLNGQKVADITGGEGITGMEIKGMPGEHLLQVGKRSFIKILFLG